MSIHKILPEELEQAQKALREQDIETVVDLITRHAARVQAASIRESRFLYKDFACLHEDKNLEDEYQRALRRLQCAPERFLNVAIQILNWNYHISITGIGNDMWSAISAERRVGREKERIYIECDIVEHGLARLVHWAMDNLDSEEEI